MKIAQHRYSVFHFTRVIMAAGESYRIPAAENDASIGVWCVKGGTEPHPSLPPPPVHLPQAGEGLLLNDARTGWSNDTVGHHDLVLYAPVDTEWVCVAEAGAGRFALAPLRIEGESPLAAGTGVIVVSGALSLDGKAGGADAWFRPRPAAATLSGRGEAILVRPA